MTGAIKYCDDQIKLLAKETIYSYTELKRAWEFSGNPDFQVFRKFISDCAKNNVSIGSLII